MRRFKKPDLAMLVLLWGVIVILCFSVVPKLFAQTAAEEAMQSALGSTEDDGNRLFVLQFSSTGMTESAAKAFSNMIARNLDNTNRFEIIPLEMVEEEIQKQDPSLLPCFEIGCGIQMGKLMRFDWILSGHISLTSSGLFNLNIKLVHILDYTLAFEDTIRFTDENMDRRFYHLSNRIANNAPLIGHILEANNKISVIDLGEQDGISVGDHLVIYRKKTIAGDTGQSQSIIVQKQNIGILKITRVGKRVSEGVYFQIIDTPEPKQFVTSYLDKRKQIKLIDEIRKELDTQQRNVYEIKKSVVLSPVQLEDIAKRKWAKKKNQLEYEKNIWQLGIIASGGASAYLFSQFEKRNELKLAAIGALGFATYQYFNTNNLLKELLDEGRYKGYLELKIRPDLGEAKLEFRLSF
ncbi:MAG: hypothetical protein GY866_05260 [Proteobacteria bacterium]|nr:hypothetical protein [Pseudomonadota bacterium]